MFDDDHRRKVNLSGKRTESREEFLLRAKRERESRQLGELRVRSVIRLQVRIFLNSVS